MFEKISTTLKSPDFQRKAAHVAGGVVSIVATAVISNMVSRVIDTGIDAVMDKIHPQEQFLSEE
jgi:hypothetical protein